MEAAKVGVMIPTFNRPDLLRSSVLQLASQSRPPDVICVFQNGHPQSYQWAVEDLRTASRLIWMHTAQQVRQHDWYAVPLRQLLELACTHFFWADDDDLYLHDHIASGLADLRDHDFSVSKRCGLLFTRDRKFGYQHAVEFTSHAPGGMSSTMCFNRPFAQELLRDISADSGGGYTDSVLAAVTMPKFRCHVSRRRTSIYHAHDGSATSHGWVEKTFGLRPATETKEDAAMSQTSRVDSLISTPTASFDRPFEMMSACHDKMQRTLSLLERLRAHLGEHGADEQARQAAHDVMRYFDKAAPQHHSDEELHVFPPLLAGHDEPTRAVVQRLQQEHVRMEASWETTRGVLAAIAEGRLSSLDATGLAALDAFSSLYAGHITAEEQIVYPAAAALLDEDAVTAMGREMAARRGA